MAKFIESFGRWGIEHNLQGIIIAVMVTVIVSYVVYDFKTSKQGK